MWTREASEIFSARAYTKGVPQKSIEICEAAGENPYDQLMDLGPRWFHFVEQAREALGLKDDDLEQEPGDRHFLLPGH